MKVFWAIIRSELLRFIPDFIYDMDGITYTNSMANIEFIIDGRRNASTKSSPEFVAKLLGPTLCVPSQETWAELHVCPVHQNMFTI